MIKNRPFPSNERDMLMNDKQIVMKNRKNVHAMTNDGFYQWLGNMESFFLWKIMITKQRQRYKDMKL